MRAENTLLRRISEMWCRQAKWKSPRSSNISILRHTRDFGPIFVAIVSKRSNLILSFTFDFTKNNSISETLFNILQLEHFTTPSPETKIGKRLIFSVPTKSDFSLPSNVMPNKERFKEKLFFNSDARKVRLVIRFLLMKLELMAKSSILCPRWAANGRHMRVFTVTDSGFV